MSEAIFRFRNWILTLLIVAGLWAPWERMGGARPESTWLFLAGLLTRNRILTIANATIAVMAAAILLAFLAALLRTWAAAYLGHGTIQSRAIDAHRIVADGPYRFLRNPLYIGTWLHTLALAVLMPPGGALFAIIAVALLNIALVRVEEKHLMKERGESYIAYAKKVPRFFPARTFRVPSSGMQASGVQANWRYGFLGEIYFWGVAVVYLAFASRYNVTVLEQGVLISLGIGVVVRGIWRPQPVAAEESTSIQG